MQKLTRVLVFVLVVVMGMAATSQAQQSERRFFTSIDGGYQSGGQRLQGRVTEDVYDESQISDTDYTIDRSAALFRANVTARLQPHLGFGFGFTRSVSSGSADLTAAVPHPLFVNRPRMVSAELMALGHRENMYHFQAVWFVPLDERIQIQLFAGPSMIRLEQALVTGLTAVDEPPFTLESMTQVALTDVAVEEMAQTGMGFNVGLDFSYMFADHYGVGGFVQYGGGAVDFAIGSGATSVTVGGVQFGAGLRFRL